MPLTKHIADAFGVLTISLVSLNALLGLVCIYCSLYFHLRIRSRGSLQLGYFSGPWIIRIALILVAIWWGLGEILRLSLLRGRIGLMWQRSICKFYILSNLGFAEPTMFLILASLLHAALQKRESGTLSRQWNRRAVGCVLLICFPLFVMQLVLVLVGPKLRTKMAEFFTTTSSLTEDENLSVCTYPLLNTIILGVFISFLMGYVSCIGARLIFLVINKGLRRRVCLLILSVLIFPPVRVLLLGFSVLLQPEGVAYEAIVFLAFLMLLFCAVVGICILVYFPVADSLALRELVHIEIEEMIPYDDDDSESASLIANQSHVETRRNSDASLKRGSASFRSLIKNEAPPIPTREVPIHQKV